MHPWPGLASVRTNLGSARQLTRHCAARSCIRVSARVCQQVDEPELHQAACGAHTVLVRMRSRWSWGGGIKCVWLSIAMQFALPARHVPPRNGLALEGL